MALSVFDLFSIGIGPSSSHTVGPMRAARDFALEVTARFDGIDELVIDLYGSLAATGRGHNTFGAVLLGLEGAEPETIDPEEARERTAELAEGGILELLGLPGFAIPFAIADLRLHPLTMRSDYANEISFTAFRHGERIEATYYSVGGGFIERAGAPSVPDNVAEPFPFDSAAELLDLCLSTGMSMAEIMRVNERTRRADSQIDGDLLRIWQVMDECIANGWSASGFLPGALRVPRRAPALAARLASSATGWAGMEWATAAAMAVNEENAGGGRVVTAPTNGAAGIIPAVLHYFLHFELGDRDRDEAVTEFLLTAGAIGMLYKKRASISGADVGCQGEVGSACSMAAAGLTAVLGGTPEQIENAAEIAMEHNLGLTCDPIGGLVQIPCIERNGMAAVKAITATRIALSGDGRHLVSLDQVIETMRQTGADMHSKYKETSRGGLAVNVPEC